MATAVIAFGGNAFVPEDASGSYPQQAATIQQMAHVVADVHRRGYRVVIVHGNGPQVGALAIQHEAGASEVPAQPLFVLDAMTQGQLGHMLAIAVRNVMEPDTPVSVVLTHVVVDHADAAFDDPTKPIGPFYQPDEARRLARDRGWTVRPVGSDTCRRVVASPAPVEIVELDSVRMLTEAGAVVIAGGGGGIPIVRTNDGLHGVDAVIDKDRVACRIAHQLDATLLVLVTGVPAVAVDFGTPDERTIDQMTLAQARTHLADGQFPAGSMGPKVSSAVDFVSGDGNRLALITSDAHVVDGLDGRHGTRISDVAAPHSEEIAV
ncbi:carbamate kinase [soil metagenome]